jgi:hypothetical protein
LKFRTYLALPDRSLLSIYKVTRTTNGLVPVLGKLGVAAGRAGNRNTPEEGVDGSDTPL